MKNLSKIGLLALVTAISFTACTKDNNAVTPQTGTATVHKANTSSLTLARRDTITPVQIINPLVRRDTITPIKIIISAPNFRRDTITPGINP